jgi:hypothetical protein
MKGALAAEQETMKGKDSLVRVEATFSWIIE